LAGRPVRPGKADDGSLLIPLVKARSGEDAPLFAIEILYWTHDTAWTTKGRATLALPALDLPVSRTGLVVYSSPLFRVTPEPGAFRTQAYERPASAVFGGDVTVADWSGPGAVGRISAGSGTGIGSGSGAGIGAGPNGGMIYRGAAVPARGLGDRATDNADYGSAFTADAEQPLNGRNPVALQQLVDTYNQSSAAKRATAGSPVRVSFPTVGPWLYLVCELTGEGKSATLDLNYQKEKKGGVK
jgi:hypothetical protein